MRKKIQWLLNLSICAAFTGLMLNLTVVHTRIVYVCAIGGATTFFASCGLLQKFKEIAFWKFAVYLVLIVVPSTIISGITTDMSHNFFVTRNHFFVLRPDIRPNPQLFLFFCAFTLFVSLNFMFWRALFNLKIRQALWVSIPVGLINTIAYLMATPIFK